MPTNPDWASIRDDFPALRQDVNGKPLVYLDNAATTQKPCAVIDALSRFYERDNANVHRGLHALSMRATDDFEGARSRVAKFIGAAVPEEIVFTRGTTESINLVAASWGGANLRTGDVILLTEMEHHSNIVPWQLIAQKTGAKLRYIPVTGDEGLLDLSQLDRLLTPEVKIFAFTHISNTLGTINPVADLCARARRTGVLTVVDAAQSIGHMPLDVQSIGCDFLAFSGHKMAGVTGIGVLYGRRELLDAMPPYQGGGGMTNQVTLFESRWKPSPERFEAGTPNFADAYALGIACDYLDAVGREAIARHDGGLARGGLRQAIRAAGHPDHRPAWRPRRSGQLRLRRRSRPRCRHFFRPGWARARGGHHCNQPLMAKLGLTSTARASFYVYNTSDEIDVLVRSLTKLLKFFGVDSR